MRDRQERCETCRWWEYWDDACNTQYRLGECHRHAPIPLLCADDPTMIGKQQWPNTRAIDFCGEYQPTPPAAATSHVGDHTTPAAD